MKHLANLGLLLLFCMVSLFFTHPDMGYILAFLYAIILICVILACTGRILLSLACLGQFAITIFCPDFLFFCPLSVYGLLCAVHKNKMPVLSASVLFLLLAGFLLELPLLFLFLYFWGFAAAYLLEQSASTMESMEDRLRRTQDDSTERDLLLTEKNRSLMEKQDYEVQAATLRERNRIAREIHDNVGHLLSRSILLTGAVKAVNHEPGLEKTLDSLEESLGLAMDSIRSSVHDLRDEAVDLDDAIRSLLKDFTFCPVTYCYDCGPNVPREVKYGFIAITKEALSNIIRHSSATRASVTLREHPAIYQLCIEDNGTGRDSRTNIPGISGTPGAGMGLSNMKDRTDRLGGYFHILTEHGFKILITIPKETTV